MVHQHFKLVECFSVLENIILGVEDSKNGMLLWDKARQKVKDLSERYGLYVDPDAIIALFSRPLFQKADTPVPARLLGDTDPE